MLENQPGEVEVGAGTWKGGTWQEKTSYRKQCDPLTELPGPRRRVSPFPRRKRSPPPLLPQGLQTFEGKSSARRMRIELFLHTARGGKLELRSFKGVSLN